MIYGGVDTAITQQLHKLTLFTASVILVGDDVMVNGQLGKIIRARQVETLEKLQFSSRWST